jgi:DUF971 family protein
MNFHFIDNHFKSNTPRAQVVLAISQRHQIEAVFSTGGIKFEVGAECLRMSSPVRSHQGDDRHKNVVSFSLDQREGAD